MQGYQERNPVKTLIYYMLLGSLGILSSCSHFSFRSKESIEAEEKKPWDKDEATVEGVFHKSKQRLTPHIGFKVPLDSGSNPLKVSRNDKSGDIKTSIDKKRQTIEIIKDDGVEKIGTQGKVKGTDTISKK
jgi:hypothetical protein